MSDVLGTADFDGATEKTEFLSGTPATLASDKLPISLQNLAIAKESVPERRSAVDHSNYQSRLDNVYGLSTQMQPLGPSRATTDPELMDWSELDVDGGLLDLLAAEAMR